MLVFTPIRPFKLTVMLVGKVMGLPLREAPYRFSTWVGSSINHTYYTTLEKLARHKHTSFLQTFVTYHRKKFYNIGHLIKLQTFIPKVISLVSSTLKFHLDQVQAHNKLLKCCKSFLTLVILTPVLNAEYSQRPTHKNALLNKPLYHQSWQTSWG